MASSREPQRTGRARDHPGLHVVGIGASAGGLDPLQEFFDCMPPDADAAFVVVQHLSPDFKSVMDELLSRHTRMRVHRAEHRMALEPDAIYLIPPKKNLVISDAGLLLADQELERGQPPVPIDIFLESLAANFGERAAAVILSGSGSDGTRGIRAINENGGVVFVQDPQTAQFDGMPRTAILTGLADYVLPPAELARAVYDFVREPPKVPVDPTDATAPLDADQLRKITTIVSSDHPVDFSHYEPSTLGRRIGRRIRISGQPSVEDYTAFLEGSEQERIALRNDMLIRVTGFFRDSDFWGRLENHVLPRLVERAGALGQFRAWVAGCCSGEEAYSLGMLVLEAIERAGGKLDAKIFATDIDQGVLDQAMAGVYPTTIADEVPERRLQQFFKKQGNGYAVTRELREIIIFARHNLARDAPFTRMQLISCRNVLIYMRPELQQRVLAVLNFALEPRGALFLGSAETVSDLADDFREIDRKARIFEKLGESRRRRALGEEVLGTEAFGAYLRERRSAFLVVTTGHQLLQAFGDTSRFLRVPEGRRLTEVTRMVPKALALPVKTALHRAVKSEGAVAYRDVRVSDGTTERKVTLRASYTAPSRAAGPLLTILLEEGHGEPAGPAPLDFDGDAQAAQRIGDLESELQHARENLQTTIEELETTNEEQQATNEELIASNEEVQSTNEELHSVNDELHTVNAEYQAKIQELSQVNDDMDNLLASTDIGTVFLDRDLRVRKFTPAATRVFNLLEQDIGRSIDHITHQIEIDTDLLMSNVRAVLESGNAVECDVENRDRMALLMRITAYRDHRGRVEGVVLTFVDVSETRRALAESGLLRRLTDSIAASRDFHSAVEVALREVCETCRWDYGEAWLPNDDGSALVASPAWYGAAKGIEGFRNLSETMRFVRGQGMPGRAWATGAPEWTRDVRGEGRVFRRAEAASRAGLAACLSVPVMERDAVVAVLGFFMREPAAEDKRLVDLVSTVATQLGAALQRKRGEEALRETSELLRQLTENVGEVFYVRDGRSHRFLYVSPAYERLWGRSARLLLESPEEWIQAVHEDDRARVEEVLRGQAENPLDQRYRIARPDGAVRWVWDRTFPMHEVDDDSGRPLRIVGIAQDVTHQHEIEELARSNEDLEQFAYVASHDLKAPLRGVSNLAAWIAEDIAEKRLDAAQERLAQLCGRVDRMKALIEGLLQYSRAGRIAEDLVEVDTAALVREAAQQIDPVCDCALECGDKMPVLRTVRTPLLQVFVNLIGNAIKHHDRDTCRIAVSARAVGSQYEFCVADDGPGIPAEHRERVFQLFQTLRPRDEVEGAGIGMALVKRIVEEFGGQVALDQNQPRGLIARFTWPAEPGERARP